ncbi:MAG: GxGYxYP domain-containing protein [Bacteroidota bacterium]
MRITVAALIVLSALTVVSQTHQAILYDGSGTPPEHKIAAMTLAGIVNRDAPRLYLQNVYETWSYNQTDETWREIYASDGGVVFTQIHNLDDLILHFSDHIHGVITYDPALTYGNFSGQNFRWQAEVAAMAGGLTDCIPLPYNYSLSGIDYPDTIAVPDHFHGQDTIYIPAKLELESHPWSDADISQEERYFLILDWALQTLLPRTNTRKFYLREITDWAVSQRMFQLNLAGSESLNFYSLTDEKAEKIEQVMTYLRNSHPDEVFHVYGWMRPEPLVQWISAWGGSFHETLLGNLSWHHSFPADQDFTYQRPSWITPDEVTLENKHYVIFIGTEGDAGNWNFGFQSGAWLSSARGDVPLAWGFNLHFFKEFPFVGQYYFKTATPNDGFISVTHPLGYAYSDMFPESFLPDAIERSSWKIDRYKIPAIYAYKHYNGAGVSSYRDVVISNNYNFQKLGAFAEEMGAELTFLFDPALDTQKAYTMFGGLLYNHVNDDTFYADVTDINAAAQRVVNKLANKPRPSFLLAGYQRLRSDGTAIGVNNKADITLPRLQQLMEMVLADPETGQHVEFVTPEQFTWLLQKSLEPVSTREPSSLHSSNITSYYDGSGNLKVNAWITQYETLYFSVLDLSGRLLMQKEQDFAPGYSVYTVPLGNLPSGMYILHVKGTNVFMSRKFIF